MAIRDAGEDWRHFDAGSIPSKDSTPELDRFVARVRQGVAGAAPLELLDVGCGTGRLARRLFEQGFSVLGVDISPDAIAAAGKLAVVAGTTGRSLRFSEADFAADRAPRLDGGPFDVVVCQLVLSIIGDAVNRTNLLRHIRGCLRPGGWVYLSASGVSDTINAGYARLYADDIHLTGEQHSYFSRDRDGRVLYMTHHFTVDEIVPLLEANGFGQISITTGKEASSRRPEEAAFFHYATCRLV